MKEIRIGVGAGDAGGTPLAKLLDQIRSAEQHGFQSVWLPNIFGMDPMTLSALAGRETSRIEVGTAVVPTFSRHPFYMAQQALTTQAALGGRFVLGLGPSHKVVIEDLLGLSFQHPARHVREYVTVVKDLFETGKSRFEGEVFRVRTELRVDCNASPPLLIGALGPRMRAIAGALCEGTITWMTGPRTIGEQIVPDLRAAAEEAGRAAPRIVAGIPVCLTRDPDGARQEAARTFAMYGSLPSYRAMLEAEGLTEPAEIAIAGDERTLEAAIRRFAEAGATDFHASLFPDRSAAGPSLKRTREFLGALAGG
jgi:F420-dependent oxidoreductase-like protein